MLLSSNQKLVRGNKIMEIKDYLKIILLIVVMFLPFVFGMRPLDTIGGTLAYGLYGSVSLLLINKI